MRLDSRRVKHGRALGLFRRGGIGYLFICHSICGPLGGGVRRRVASPVGSICCPGFIVTFRARGGKSPCTGDRDRSGKTRARDGALRSRGCYATLTVPRNHELMTPGHVSPLSSTLIPPVNTAVLAAAAGTRPGLGLARNAGIVSRNGGSAAGGAGDRRVRWGPFSLDEVPTGDASGDADATRRAVLEDGAGVVAHRRHVTAADVAIVVIEPTPPSCCAVRRTLLAFVK